MPINQEGTLPQPVPGVQKGNRKVVLWLQSGGILLPAVPKDRLEKTQTPVPVNQWQQPANQCWKKALGMDGVVRNAKGGHTNPDS